MGYICKVELTSPTQASIESTHRDQDIKEDKMRGQRATRIGEFPCEPPFSIRLKLVGDIYVV